MGALMSHLGTMFRNARMISEVRSLAEASAGSCGQTHTFDKMKNMKRE